MSVTTKQLVNDINTEGLRQAIREITEDSSKGMTTWMVSTEWKGGTRSDTTVRECKIGGQSIKRDFKIRVDEPLELCGTNQYANPQEYLLAAFNACMTVGYAVGCAMHGIVLESLRIETEGEIDLRGFMEIDTSVKPGYEGLRYKVFIKGEGTAEQFKQVHETVQRTSPNRFNLANAIPVKGQLIKE